MKNHIKNVSTALDNTKGVIQSFISTYSMVMKKPLTVISGVVSKGKDKLTQPDFETIDKTLRKMENLLDKLVTDISKPKSL